MLKKPLKYTKSLEIKHFFKSQFQLNSTKINIRLNAALSGCDLDNNMSTINILGPFHQINMAMVITARLLKEQEDEVSEQLWTEDASSYQLTLESIHLFIPLLSSRLPFPFAC